MGTTNYDFTKLKLLSREANNTFGTNYLSLDDMLVEVVLRYVALTHRGDTPIDELKIPRITYWGEKSANQVNKAWLEETMGSNYGDVLVLRSSFSNVENIDEYVKETWGQEWETLDTKEFPLNDFLSKIDSTGNYETKCFINSQTENVVIIAKTISTKWKRTLTSALFRILRRFYPTPEAAQQDKELFSSISMLGSAKKIKHPVTGELTTVDLIAKEKIFNLAEKSCEGIDFANYALMGMLRGYASAAFKRQIGTLENEQINIVNNIANYEQTIAQWYDRLKNLENNLSLLRGTASKDETEKSIVQFFKTHKEISVQSVESSDYGAKIFYFVKTTLEYFDEDEFMRISQNRNSYYNSRCPEYDFARPLIKAALIDGLAEIKVQSEFYLNNLNSITVGYHDTCYEDNTHMPHPHLAGFRCLGANSQYIQKYCQEGNWDMAIEQTISATKNINFSDSTVIQRFMGEIYRRRNSKKCFALPDGRELTALEFTQYLAENKKIEVNTNE